MHEHELPAGRRLIDGSRTTWRVTRTGEIAFVLAAVLFNSGPAYQPISASVSFLIVFLMLAQFRSLAYGFLESDGLSYRTYFKWRKVRWEQIESISRSSVVLFASTIQIDLTGNSVLNRRIALGSNPVIFGKPTGDATFEDVRKSWLAGASKQLTE